MPTKKSNLVYKLALFNSLFAKLFFLLNHKKLNLNVKNIVENSSNSEQQQRVSRMKSKKSKSSAKAQAKIESSSQNQ